MGEVQDPYLLRGRLSALSRQAYGDIGCAALEVLLNKGRLELLHYTNAKRQTGWQTNVASRTSKWDEPALAEEPIDYASRLDGPSRGNAPAGTSKRSSLG